MVKMVLTVEVAFGEGAPEPTDVEIDRLTKEVKRAVDRLHGPFEAQVTNVLDLGKGPEEMN